MQTKYRRLRDKMAAACAAVLLLTGCGGAVPLSERAIVKAIYLDRAGDEVQAALVIYTCEPSADTADVTGVPRVVTGTGPSIADALYDAERQQNKKVFYAQNRTLWIGPKAAKENVSECLSYFGAQDTGGAEFCAFLVPLSRKELEDCGEKISGAIKVTEHLSDASRREGNATTAAFEANYDSAGEFYGYLPQLDFSPDAPEEARVSELAVFSGGRQTAILTDAQMQLALLFSGKQNTLTLHLEADGKRVTVKTQELFVEKEISAGTLALLLRGKTERITREGKTLQGQEQEAALAACNTWIEAQAQQLLLKTIYTGNDIFSWRWFAQNAGRTVLRAGVASTLRAA